MFKIQLSKLKTPEVLPTIITVKEDLENYDHLSIVEMVEILKQELNTVTKEKVMKLENIEKAEQIVEESINNPHEIEKRGFRIPKPVLIAAVVSMITIGSVGAYFLKSKGDKNIATEEKKLLDKKIPQTEDKDAEKETNDFWAEQQQHVDKEAEELKARKQKADKDFAKALDKALKDK